MTFVFRSFTGTHFIHPSTAIPTISTKDKTRSQINTDLIVEALIVHVGIQGKARTTFSIGQRLHVTKQDFLNHVVEMLIMCTGRQGWTIVRWIETRDFIREDFMSIGHALRIGRDWMKPPPDSISRIVPSEFTIGKEIRNQAVAKALTVGENQITRFLVTTGEQQKSA